ncbi:hypothetical protein GCM10023219_03770 [Stakelama sediminis]|uniref:Putative membrane protein n=1 Tax=Stakelama sediminis TaxID=463200 RepID=A0A840YZB9_9SPHN|nr:hypothetical protein [Stakelama sediminis]MBB5718993.1 putative membrane protein [Stakelama sediminis]
MDSARGIEDRMDHDDVDDGNDAVADSPLEIGTDERRMHVRAYNHWVSLLKGRTYPSIDDLNPENIADFGPHSVLLDFTQGLENPAIRFLGVALREECGVDIGIDHIAEVPSRSLLSRLTDHYLQIIANRAPIGFEAEFIGQRGHNTLYRGILMPFSSDGEAIDFIYGVINWKELVDAETQAKLNSEIEEARKTAPRTPLSTAVWADGPDIASDQERKETQDDDTASASDTTPLADRLMLARETAAAVRAADTRSRAALYRALSRAYDFSLAAEAEPESYTALLEQAQLKVQERAPMTPVVKLVFGSDYDKARITEFAAALSHGKRLQVPQGRFGDLLNETDGGLKALVKAERAARRPAPRPDRYERALATLRARPALAHVPVGAGDSEFVLLLARKGDDGAVDIVARVDKADALIKQAVRRVAG